MLRDNVKKYVFEKQQSGESQIALFNEEKEYALKNELIPDNVTIIENDNTKRFSDAYIEIGNKETEETIREEGPDFLANPIHYFEKNLSEFMYLESKTFEMIKVDAISFETDDVFRTYDVMLGLKLPKKFGPTIKSFLENEIQGEASSYDLIFSQNDGLWDFNFTLNDVNGFDENMTIGEAYQLIYRFLFKLVEGVEKGIG